MGTSNFYNVNSSKIFVVLQSYERPVLDDDFNETEEMEFVCPDEMEVSDELDYFESMLKDNIKEDIIFYNYGENFRSEHENRNFPSHYLGSVYKSKTYGDIECQINIHCFVRSGYYDGGNLDWELDVRLDGDSYTDDIKQISDMFEMIYSDMNVGMLKIQGKNCQKWGEKTYDKLKEYVESIFEQCSTPYNLVGRFSNGETIYEKC